MSKFSFLILFFLIFLFLFSAKDIFAKQEVYISEVRYLIDDDDCDPGNHQYHPGTGKGVIAWIEDTNGPASGGKVYHVANNLPASKRLIYDGDQDGFEYATHQIAMVTTNSATAGHHHRLYTCYTVRNTGDDQIEDIRVLGGESWGTDINGTIWSINNSWTISSLPDYLNPGEVSYPSQGCEIENFPTGYLWKDIGLNWADGTTVDAYGVAILYTNGPNFSPPDFECPYPDSKIEYGNTYTLICNYQNDSPGTVYLKLENPDFATRLCGTWGARYVPPSSIPGNAIFYEPFSTWDDGSGSVITLNPGQTTKKKTVTINNISSSFPQRNVNLSHLGAGFCHRLCTDASCTQFSPLGTCTWPTVGHGTGKYLGIKDLGALSKTIIKPDDTPSYLVYFNLWNPDTLYNEEVDGDDYYIDIQIIEEGEEWYQDGSTSIWWSGNIHEISVADLQQESTATQIFPGVFGDDDNNPVTGTRGKGYPFFYEIPNIDHLPTEADKSYSLYITTIWKGVNHQGHPLAGQEEPIDQVKRSFAPFAYLYLKDVTLPASQSTVSTSQNYIRNISSTFSITVTISLSISDPKLSISPSTLTFPLGPGQTIFFQLDFQYNGSKPSSDIIDTLTGQAFIQITGSPILSHTNQAQIFIEKAIDLPTAHNLSVTPDYCQRSFPLVRVNWEFDDPTGHFQKAVQIQVDTDSSFSSPLIVDINGNAGSHYFQNPGEQLSWNTNYYWRIKVWCDNNTESDWIYPPSHQGSPTLPPGDLFETPVNRFPDVSFFRSPEKPTGGETVHFIDESICYDANSLCDSWQWDFGNGQVSTEQNPTHSFFGIGLSKVTLMVSDSNDYSCEASQNLDITLPLPNWKEMPPF